MQIVDRRLNPGGRSLGNRQRFVERARAAIREAVRESAGERRLRDAERGGEVAIPASGIAEPQFHRGQGGRQERVLPGNRDYLEGDRIPRPPGGAGGRGSRGSPEGGGEDSFRFALTDAEFLDLLLEDLELPDLAKKRATEEVAQGVRRAGFATQGSPSNLSLTRTLRNAMSRRLALSRRRRRGWARGSPRCARAACASPGSTRWTCATGSPTRRRGRSPRR
jgi:uncharacterized sporulation protein YeaH/YhbH (DUF444 family)